MPELDEMIMKWRSVYGSDPYFKRIFLPTTDEIRTIKEELELSKVEARRAVEEAKIEDKVENVEDKVENVEDNIVET